jgi:hypothetical protein
MMQYLLGELSPEQRETLEREYFSNDEEWNRLRAAEDDLIDAYARGRLSPEQRARFEHYFLASAQMRERVEFAYALKDTQPMKSPSRLPMNAAAKPRSQNWNLPLSIVLGAACLMLVITIGVLGTQIGRLRSELTAARSDRNALHSQLENLQRYLSSADASQSASDQTISLLLRPHLLRGDEGNALSHVVQIRSGTTYVRLLLTLESAEYADYQVVLRPVAGLEVIRQQGLRMHLTQNGAKLVEMGLPEDLLPPADYVAVVSGRVRNRWEIIDSYWFSVVR